MAPEPNHAFKNPAAHGQSWVSTGHILNSAGSGGRGSSRGGGMAGAPDMAGDVTAEDHYAGGSGGGHAVDPEHAQAPDESQDEGEPQEGQELPGRPAGKPHVGTHRQQAPTPVDRLGEIENNMAANLEGPRRTLFNRESGHYTLGDSTPWPGAGQNPVIRPGSLPITNPDHPLMANYQDVIRRLQEPGAPQS
jgi:hypothetical protein